MNQQLINGIHHVTAMSSGAQANVDFYAGVLGLRLVKKTVNFDAPDVYHLYYGDEGGNPGSIMTFFPFPRMRPGHKGKGQVVTTSFSVTADALDYWVQRLKKFGIEAKAPQERFEEVAIYFEDKDGLGLELVANDKDERKGFSYGQIPVEYAIKGFYGVEILQDTYEKTDSLLTVHMNHKLLGESGNKRRYGTSDEPGKYIDISWNSAEDYGHGGTGTVHHVAFRTENDESQLKMKDLLSSVGYQVTPVMDRNYFHSIYYREPGGVLFEIATDPPGFTVDEAADQLGEGLKLPSQYESHRSELEASLEPINFNADDYV